MKYRKLLYQLYRLKQNENYSREKMLAYQEKKRRELLRYAFEHSDYYRKTFLEVGITERNIESKEITEFPCIDKQTFLAHFDELITVDGISQQSMREFDQTEHIKEKKYGNQYHLVHSSGSTGKPAYFLYDETAWQIMLLGIIRAALWDMSFFQIIRLLIKKPRIMYLAATDGRYGGAMSVGDGIDALHMQQQHLDVQSPLKEWVGKVNEFKPHIIIGYPSAIKILAELTQENKISVHITRVITCGEPLPENLETMFVTAFSCAVVNVYGASESLALGVGISGKEGISLFDDLNYIEVENHQIYLTCLYNYTQPIIRYRLSDELELVRQEASAKTFTTVEKIVGRHEDLLWFEDGDGNKEFLHPLSIEGICVEGLRDYQFRKIDKDAFEMFAEIDPHANKEQIKEAILQKIKEVLQEKQLHYVTFCVNFVDCIYPDKVTGKKKLIII